MLKKELQLYANIFAPCVINREFRYGLGYHDKIIHYANVYVARREIIVDLWANYCYFIG